MMMVMMMVMMMMPQCEEARTVLLKRWLPEVAMVFVKQRKAWASLVPRYPSYIYFYFLQYLA